MVFDDFGIFSLMYCFVINGKNCGSFPLTKSGTITKMLKKLQHFNVVNTGPQSFVSYFMIKYNLVDKFYLEISSFVYYNWEIEC